MLNLSSGTPQIKAALAILAVEEGWCKGIQVDTPEKSSNHANKEAEGIDVDALWEIDEDNGEAEPNRCSEPPLRIFRYFAEKNRIISLVNKYEYSGAYELIRENANAPEKAKMLVQHAMYRSQLLLELANGCLKDYDEAKQFRMNKKDKQEEKHTEYFYLMQIDCKKEQYASMLVKGVPLLYELLFTYVTKDTGFPIMQYCAEGDNGEHCLQKHALEQKEPGLLSLFNGKYGFKDDSPLSFYILSKICTYITEKSYVKDCAIHKNLLKEIAVLSSVNKARNSVAHTIVNMTKNKFTKMILMEPEEVMEHFGKIIKLVYRTNADVLVYDTLNEWIIRELEEVQL